MVGVPFEERNLDAVKAGRLELGEERKVLLRDVGVPEEQVHAGFHGVTS